MFFFQHTDSNIYNKTDKGGWCFVAYCTSTCNVEIKPQPCNFTTLPPPQTSPSFQISTTSSSTPVHGRSTSSRIPPPSDFATDCLYLKPPRKVAQKLLFLMKLFLKKDIICGSIWTNNSMCSLGKFKYKSLKLSKIKNCLLCIFAFQRMGNPGNRANAPQKRARMAKSS